MALFQSGKDEGMKELSKWGLLMESAPGLSAGKFAATGKGMVVEDRRNGEPFDET
eukprot:CAMPEP_0197447562 /NCGR_PEP_ID=MMETSP1175-20131217/13736_1 /TAXON_ID=1003142 /ORGANISM="Triceratium dubium, Strain CCMP147" /LENGTH=54 /DNA_ID=CAMNT_0042978931 /DNA_START=47 /DNA_END=211 /DNA_ORIENTATION=-